MQTFDMKDFVRESNRIERIHRVTAKEIEAHERLLAVDVVTVGDLERFVTAIQPTPSWNRRIPNGVRRERGQDVRVGSYSCPPGGPDIERKLEELLYRSAWESAFAQHAEYEMLHPFLDGNGRSGRALWLHGVGGIDGAPNGFLMPWYFWTLGKERLRT